LVTGVSYAYWTSTASGTATVGSTAPVNMTVASITTPLTDLFPGKTDDLGYKVTNTNGFAVNLTALTALSVTSSDPTNCPVSNIQLLAAATNGVLQPGGWTGITPLLVNAGSSATGSITGLVTMIGGAPNGCQSKTFTVSLSFSGTSQ
jgi:hypothetical protein